jgi:hypothetical protein
MVDVRNSAEVFNQRTDGARVAFVIGGGTVCARIKAGEIALHVLLEQLEFCIDGAVHPADEGAAGSQGVGGLGWENRNVRREA